VEKPKSFFQTIFINISYHEYQLKSTMKIKNLIVKLKEEMLIQETIKMPGTVSLLLFVFFQIPLNIAAHTFFGLKYSEMTFAKNIGVES
jgi:hypothetical protein